MKRRTLWPVVASLALAGGLPALAQSPLATYEGPDRMERIVAAAKKEGSLTLYTTIAEKDLPTLIKPFEGLHKLLPDGRVGAYMCPAGYPTQGWGIVVPSLQVPSFSGRGPLKVIIGYSMPPTGPLTEIAVG